MYPASYLCDPFSRKSAQCHMSHQPHVYSLPLHRAPESAPISDATTPPPPPLCLYGFANWRTFVIFLCLDSWKAPLPRSTSLT